MEKYLIVVLWSLMDCRMGSAVRADPYKVVILRSEPPSLDSPPPHLHLNLISKQYLFPLFALVLIVVGVCSCRVFMTFLIRIV